MRLIAYTRVSTEEQAEKGHSLSLQPDLLRGWCERNGHELVGEVTDEGVSASIPLRKRAGGAALLGHLAAGRADGVIALRPDRLFRSARDGLWFVEEFCIHHRVSLFVVEGGADTSTPAGWLALAMQLVAAQYARLIDVQRGREVNAALRRQGRVYGGVPYACVKRDGKLYRDPRLWGVRELIVSLRGEQPGAKPGQPGSKPGMSLANIADWLFDNRHRPECAPPGGGVRWSKATLKNVLDTHEQLASLPWLPTPETDGAGTPSPTV